MKFFLKTLIMLGPVFVLASGAEHAAGDQIKIPLYNISMQALNLGILLVALIYFVRKSIVGFFFQRQIDFKEKSEKTAAALRRAELELKDIKNKLSLIESTQASSAQAAHAESEKMKNKFIQDAAIQAEKIKADVALIINAEFYKAKNEIRNQIIEKATAIAKENARGSAVAITEKSEKSLIYNLGQVKA